MSSPASADPYASHLPVLRALVEMVKPRAVLEFGAGDYSTPFFLTLDIESLWSVETDPAWAVRAQSNDTRHTVAAEAPSLSGFDLVFIDDGKNASDREHTIRNVLKEDHPVFVIHDAEVPEYRAAIHDLASERAVFCALAMPQTAVIWPKGTNRSNALLNALTEDA